jgi:hypothetical protein
MLLEEGGGEVRIGLEEVAERRGRLRYPHKTAYCLSPQTREVIIKADDPRLEIAHQEMIARIKKYDERMLTVIKNHLGCEDFLNELLSAAGRRWKNRLFAGKLDVAKEINPPEIEPPVWCLLKASNKLRNAIAHGHKESKIAARTADLRKAYLAALTPIQAKHSEGLDDTRIVVLAFGHCGAYLGIAAEAVRARGKRG